MHSNKARKFSSQLVLEYLEEVLHLEGPVLRQVRAVDGVLFDRLAEARRSELGRATRANSGSEGPTNSRNLVTVALSSDESPAVALSPLAISRAMLVPEESCFTMP